VAGDSFKRGGRIDAAAYDALVPPDATAAWEHRAPIHLLEGTASSDSLVIPVGEVGEAIFAQGGETVALVQAAVTCKSFLHKLVAEAKGAAKGEALPPLVAHTTLEGLPFYANKQSPQQRVSEFYLGVGILASPELAAIDPRLGAVAFIDATTQTRGAEMGSFLRMPYATDTAVALVPLYGDMSRAEWDRDIAPVMACIQNQMPLACTDLVPPAEQGGAALRRVGQVIPPKVALLAPTVGPHVPLATALDRYAARRPTFVAGRVGTRAPSSDVIVTATDPLLSFYLSSYTVGQPEHMNAIFADLDARRVAGEITGYTLTRDRPLPFADDVYTLTVAVKGTQ
jgi:hypothetical protein